MTMQNYEVMSDYYNMYRTYADTACSSSSNKNKVTAATIMNLFGHRSDRRMDFMNSA